MNIHHSAIADPQQQARDWLAARGVRSACLTRLTGGHTHSVFRVEQAQAPRRSVLRLINPALDGSLCPLAQQAEAVIRTHQQAAELGLAPAVLAADVRQGIMWLADAGEPQDLRAKDFAEIQGLLQRLHGSGLDWAQAGKPADPAALTHLQTLAIQTHAAAELAASLLRQAEQRGYAEAQAVPVHSDLNPGNCLHDGQRWWLIDWDFAGMQAAQWDYASLISEFGWDVQQAVAFAPQWPVPELAWYCSNFSLLSWDWHVQRGSAADCVAHKWETVKYWAGIGKDSVKNSHY
ncbi:MAG: phosphotransferase [Thiolinea sp.]